MHESSNVLVSYSSHVEDAPTSPGGCSGILIDENWILTHGSLLTPLMGRHPEIYGLVSGLNPGKLTIVPEEVVDELRFIIYRAVPRRGSRKPGEADQESIEEAFGHVLAAWKCPLLKETFEKFFLTWNFDKSAKLGHVLMPVFLVIRRGFNKSCPVEIPTVEQALHCLVGRASGKTIRGSNIEIESTPFGNPVFIDSVARGVISNVVGNEKCVIMTDASTFPGCEGGPAYIIDDRDRRSVCGMVIAPLSWRHKEWVDYTFLANLRPCLGEVLKERSHGVSSHYPLRSLRSASNTDSLGMLDRSVVVVRCGPGWGTGILIDGDSGIFLTCSHVVNEEPEQEIRITLRKGSTDFSTGAKLVYRTPENHPYDVAVLKVNPAELDRSLKPIKLADEPAIRGEAVLSVGFPFFSTTQATISSGIVSKSMICMLQTTCCVQSGASGGAILRRATGEMLGMVVCNIMSSNSSVFYPRLSMAVPIAVVKGPLMEYLSTGDRKVLEAFTSNDVTVQRIWQLRSFLPSKM
ncbi:hypothetical protein KM043_014166 [Ampulex compressa]|nr:hypothetical protein KM043_014166 [Ampulex compressa]